ncbi:MAG TPA: RIP metalloprotease RseP [Acetobacteraceae bacterium]|nr:RIP metalloprotease RseP [Acetobacteraceae bacterium]
MLNFLPEFARTVIAFGVVLGILVFFHELGHYLAARWRGVHVEAFSIGFGRALATWTDRRGTVWKLAWIPLGGYVKLHGQERPEDASADVRALWMPGKTFHEKQVGSRAIVVAAGPIANFLLAVVLFAGLFATAGRPVPTPVVGEVIADTAANRAGLQKGDRITTIDGTTIKRFEDIQRIVSTHPGVALSVQVDREGSPLTLSVTPAAETGSDGKTIGLLGIRGGETEFEKLGPGAAVVAGFTQTWDVAAQTLGGVWAMITTHRGAADLGGPLRIAQLSGQVAELGVASLVSFIAVLSVNLGLINLFPIPILDGGHLLFYLAEAVRGRPLPPRALEYGFRAGFAVLVALFVFATWNDLSHLGIVRWVAGLIG